MMIQLFGYLLSTSLALQVHASPSYLDKVPDSPDNYTVDDWHMSWVGLGNSSVLPWNEAPKIWKNGVAYHPNATYTLPVFGDSLDGQSNHVPLWNLSIAAAYNLTLSGYRDGETHQIADVYKSRAFTGYQINYTTTLSQYTADDKLQWKACVYVGAPGVPLNDFTTLSYKDDPSDVCGAKSEEYSKCQSVMLRRFNASVSYTGKDEFYCPAAEDYHPFQ